MHTLPQTTGGALKIQYFVLGGLIMNKWLDFPYLVNRVSYKAGWPLRITVKMDLLLLF